MRSLDFSDGFESSSAPDQGIVTASTIVSFVDDAAYVAFKTSAAAAGDIYHNTTSNQIREFNGSVWREVVASQGAQTIAGTKTFSNDVIITGDLTVNGTTTTLNTTTLDVEDANVTVNKGGTQSTANTNRAGIEVEMSDAAEAGVGYDSTLASKFKVGEVGTQYEVISASHSQTLTNKTIVPASNTITLASTNILVGNGSNVATAVAVSSDATLANTGALTISNDAISNAKLANMSTQTFKGRTTAGSGDPEDLTATQATAILNQFVGDSGSGGLKGLVTAPVTGDATRFLRGDGTWQTPSGTSSAYFNGYLAGVGGGWDTSSGSYVDTGVAATSSTLTTIISNNFTAVIAEATKLPALTVTASITGVYKITAAINLANSTDATASYARMVDGSANIIAAGSSNVVRSGGGWGSVTLDGLVTLTAATPLDIKIQLAAGGSSASIFQSTLAPINWTITLVG
jgi:hypothetical protein